MDYMLFTAKTERLLEEVGALQPKTHAQCTDQASLVMALKRSRISREARGIRAGRGLVRPNKR